jgi:hypothetical protein
MRQVRHHVRDRLEATILGQVQGMRNSSNDMPAIGFPCDRFVNGLDPNFNTGTP